MHPKIFLIGLRCISPVLATALFLMNARAADNGGVVYSFDGVHGSRPIAGLIMDGAGNLYGTTESGGSYDRGTVFELSPTGGGGWTETVLYSFGENPSDGAQPRAGLIMDRSGNLYGTTNSGGTRTVFEGCAYGCGTAFQLSSNADGTWSETVLHRFHAGSDGSLPGEAGLTMDTAGNLYGATASGGIYNYGIAFELSPRVGGGWSETVLHSFGNGNDGSAPQGGLAIDAAGNLYGTTEWGGVYRHCTGGPGGCGTVFELSPSPGGGWTETVVHSFNGVDGWIPYSTLIIDARGNLYGTTVYGGVNPCNIGPAGCGTVFKVSPTGDGGWTETVLHSFAHPANDASHPWTGVTMDAAGNLYGATLDGGTYGYGTVFELSPQEGGVWNERVLHSFNIIDGISPYGLPVIDQAGNVYATTYLGGTNGKGVVFEITP